MFHLNIQQLLCLTKVVQKKRKSVCHNAERVVWEIPNTFQSKLRIHNASTVQQRLEMAGNN